MVPVVALLARWTWTFSRRERKSFSTRGDRYSSSPNGVRVTGVGGAR